MGEVGLNYATQDYIDNTDREFLEGRAFGKYEYAFNEKSRFSQSAEFLYDFEDSENYNVNSETALIFSLTNYLSVKASYAVKYDNKPVPQTLKKTDTVLSLALVANF